MPNAHADEQMKECVNGAPAAPFSLPGVALLRQAAGNQQQPAGKNGQRGADDGRQNRFRKCDQQAADHQQQGGKTIGAAFRQFRHVFLSVHCIARQRLQAAVCLSYGRIPQHNRDCQETTLFRRSFRKAMLLSFLAAALFSATPAMAQQNATAGEEAMSGDFQAWLADLRREALQKGISEKTLNKALTGLKPLRRVIHADRNQEEFTQTYWDYIARRLTPARIRKGREMLARHRKLLARISARYGVPAKYIVAFWGLETNYGSYKGKIPIIGALATLAFDRRRSDFFRVQLLDALRIIDRGDIEPERMVGSWAGAMGHMQFIPSTYIAYAVDGDGDGRVDLWSSLPDAFASAANYLSGIGWRADQRWGREVALPKNFDWEKARLDYWRKIEVWAREGLRRPGGLPLPLADFEAAVALPAGHWGPAFLVYGNFTVIMAWNRSVNYALAVGQLADALVGQWGGLQPQPENFRPLKYSEIKEIQRRLNMLGYDAGPADGIIGSRSRKAIRAYQKKAGLPADAYPDVVLLERLRKETS